MERKGWYITNSKDELIYSGARTYGECINEVRGLDFRQETQEVKEKYTIRFGA